MPGEPPTHQPAPRSTRAPRPRRPGRPRRLPPSRPAAYPPRVSDRLLARLRAHAQHQQAAGLQRYAPLLSHRDGVRYQLDGHPVIGFCGNDYLGYASEPVEAPSTMPGTGAARLIAGESTELRTLERELADLVGQPAALLFPSGYQANLGCLPALLGPEDHAWSDALNHASLIDGLRLARVQRTKIAHLACPPAPATTPTSLGWWVLESTYSMDGDSPDPTAIARHLNRGGCVYLDEAHSLGRFPGGTGWAAHHELRPTVSIGTLGKALGIAGAFAAGDPTIIAHLKTTARSAVYTTAPTPSAISQIRRLIDRAAGPDGDARRARLAGNIALLATRLTRETTSPIFPLHVGRNDTATAISRALCSRGFHVQAIRPPTVPSGTARLRVTVSASHEPTDIEQLVHALRAVFTQHGLPLVAGEPNTP